jgi:hypothetical protein
MKGQVIKGWGIAISVSRPNANKIEFETADVFGNQDKARAWMQAYADEDKERIKGFTHREVSNGVIYNMYERQWRSYRLVEKEIEL